MATMASQRRMRGSLGSRRVAVELGAVTLMREDGGCVVLGWVEKCAVNRRRLKGRVIIELI